MPTQKITVSIDPDLKELIPAYLEKMKKNCTDILNALAQDDLNVALTFGHQMKGSGGGYGFEAISTYGNMIEEAARAHQKDQIATISNELLNYLNNIEVVYG